MIIDRLMMKNFKRFRDQTICFKDGITGILGNNGAGKSSIVEAVFFCPLRGKSDRHRCRLCRLLVCVTKGAVRSSPGLPDRGRYVYGPPHVQKR